jgi:hypothetical protein
MDSTLIVIVNLNLGPGARRLESHVNCSFSKRPHPSTCPFENERNLKSQRHHLSRRCQVCTCELFALGSDCAVLTRESTSMTSAYLSLTCHTCHARRFPRLPQIAEVSLCYAGDHRHCPLTLSLPSRLVQSEFLAWKFQQRHLYCQSLRRIAKKNILRDCGPTAGRSEGRPTPNNGH